VLNALRNVDGNSFYSGNLISRLFQSVEDAENLNKRNQSARDLSEAWHIVRTAQKLTCSAIADAQLSRILRYIGGQMPIPRSY
jgi:hypothetical protein